MWIDIPRNTLVVLVGPAGSGKSTFAARNFLPTEIVSSDECRALVCDDPADQSVSKQAFELLHLIVEKRLELWRFTVADATNLTRQARGRLVKIARKHNANTAAVIFDTSLAKCLARNSARRRVVPVTAVRAQHDQLVTAIQDVWAEGFDYVYVLNESTESVAKVKITRRRWVRT